MEIQPVRDEQTSREALREISVLMETDPALGMPEGDRLDVLSTLVEVYEARLCDNLQECSTSWGSPMKELNVREMRAAIGQLDKLVDEAGEIIVSRRGRAIARILPVAGTRRRPDHADLRARTPRLTTPSAELIRAERDER